LCWGDRTGSFDRNAAFHHEIDIGEFADIRQRITVNRDEISPSARFKTPTSPA